MYVYMHTFRIKNVHHLSPTIHPYTHTPKVIFRKKSLSRETQQVVINF